MYVFLTTLSVLIISTKSAYGQFTGCDYFQSMTVGTTYNIFSPGYSSLYPANTNCRWTAQAPSGYKISISCSDIAIPASSGCVNDKLQISYTGNANLADAQTICTSGTMSSTTTSSNLITVALRVPSTSKGGRFLCTIVTNPATTSCDCGRKKTSRIVGGTQTYVNEYPEMAGLVSNTTNSIICGATIIAANYGLTAAHCVINRAYYTLALLVGDQDYTISTETSYSALYQVQSYVYHNLYSSSSNVNDIAIVKTTNPMIFNPGVGPACLPYTYASTSFVGTSLVALGWGTLAYGGASSTTLMKVSLPVISNSQCSSTYSITPSQFCTNGGTKDTCQQDSGGPLFYTDANNVVYNIGIISYGIACASSYPSVCTNVASYLSWIESQTPGVTYCKK